MRKEHHLKKLLFVFFPIIILYLSVITVSAEKTYPTVDMFKRTTSIKGVQGVSDRDVNEYGGLQHTLQNVKLNECISSTDGQNFTYSLPSGLLTWIKYCNQSNMSVSIVFLMSWDGSDSTAYLIDEASRVPGKTYYAPATTGYGEQAIKGFFDYLMQLCVEYNCHIDNFILGNEVNMPNAWHYSGTTDPTTCATKYADAFYDMYSTVRKYTDVSRCSISIDHSWNHNDEGRGIGAREYLHLFHNRLAEYESDIDWCISMHLYPAVLYETDIWATNAHIVAMDLNPKSEGASMIDGNNLSYMTNYIKNHFGEQHRVMLTEQGFSSHMGLEYQAACLAYSYYAAMYDPMVDCFLINRQNEGGVLDFSIDGRLAGEVYTRIDSGKAEDIEWIDNTILPIIGVSSWSEIVPNYGNDFRRKEGIYVEDGIRYLYTNNKIDTSFTGWYTHEGEKFWLQNGVETEIKHGIYEENGLKYLYKENALDTSYTGWYTHEGERFWLQNGVEADVKEGIYEENGVKYLYKENEKAVSYTGWYTYNGEKIWIEKGIETSREYGQEGDTSYTGWYKEGNTLYWLDKGVKAGDKEVYDPESDAWYWFDADGTMATNKDAFIPTNAERTEGKWVRYDENGGMVKGEHYQDGSWYRFDVTTGEMIKEWFDAGNGEKYYYDKHTGRMVYGAVEIDGIPCAFDESTGAAVNCSWYTVEGEKYWYEGGVRQGLEGRGKEIYDAASDAWYWLDSVDNGKKAVSKDVYQESFAGAFADREDGTGKWVRYDAQGHMIKGWNEQNGNTYYFDLVTGAMAKGTVEIDGVTYTFDWATGIKQ